MTILNPIFIKATTLSDAWFQTIYKCVEAGREFIIDRGSYKGQKRLEFDYVTIHIQHPGVLPLLPQISPQFNIPNPVEDGYLDDYLPYLMTSEKKEGESYTYGSRICEAITGHIPYKKEKGIFIDDQEALKNKNIFNSSDNGYYMNQMEMMIWTYKNKGHRNNQMILQIGQPSDMALIDPVCLRHIDTRIQDNKLHFYPYFRSWDLYGGMPANLAAIEMMKQYCAEEIGVENGEIIASSKGLHLYDYVFELAEILRGKTIEQFKKEAKK